VQWLFGWLVSSLDLVGDVDDLINSDYLVCEQLVFALEGAELQVKLFLFWVNVAPAVLAARADLLL
jgi:hypothetical protein